MNKKVSIIMPNYNCGRFIEETIGCVLHQTYPDWELLFVDDCSTDQSVEIVERYCAEDERIKLFVNSENRGAAYSRNLALREAQGRWIAFLDSDDLWVKNKLETQLRFMEENDYHFSYTEYGQIDEQSRFTGIVVGGPKKVTKHKMFRYCYPGCLTVMYDATRVGLVQIPDTVYKNNDYALWLKVCKQAPAYYLDERLAYYRKRQGSISNHSKLSLIRHHYRMFRISEKMIPIKAFYYTVKNLFYGFWKKVRYVKKKKPAEEQ